MEIGTEKPAIVVEPAEDPFKQDPAPEKEPVKVPTKEKEAVPA